MCGDSDDCIGVRDALDRGKEGSRGGSSRSASPDPSPGRDGSSPSSSGSFRERPTATQLASTHSRLEVHCNDWAKPDTESIWPSSQELNRVRWDGSEAVEPESSGVGWGDDDLDQAVGVDVLLGGGPDLVGRPGPDGRVVIRIVVGDAVPPSRTEVPGLSATLSDRVGDWAAN